METIETLTPESFVQRSNEILKIVSDEAVRAKIPLISNWENFNQLKDMQLIRFRGLVQNMMDPEIYLETYETKDDNNVVRTRKTKFRENIELEVSILIVMFTLKSKF